jgi:hypothetical protein
MTGRIPIRSALSIVVAPGDPNYLKKSTPTIAEFFKKKHQALSWFCLGRSGSESSTSRQSPAIVEE